MIAPLRAVATKTVGSCRNGASPVRRAMTSTSSRTACPAIISGPTMKPRCELSLIAAVNSGPGISAPEKAITKDEAKIVKKIVNSGIQIFPDMTFF